MDKFREWSRRSNTWQLLEIYTASSFPIYLCLRSFSRTVRETRRSHVNLPIYVGDSLFLPFLSLYFSYYLFLFTLHISLSRLCFSKFHRQRERRSRVTLYIHRFLSSTISIPSFLSLALDRQIHLRTSRSVGGNDGLRSAFAAGNAGRTDNSRCAAKPRCIVIRNWGLTALQWIIVS